MEQTKTRHGQCLCGEVKMLAPEASTQVGACHCRMCQNWGGGPLLAIDAGSDVKIEGSENVAVYASSDWAERGFCAQCGSHLFYRLKQNGQYIVPVGLFNEVDDLVFDHQIFVEQKPQYYCFSNQTQMMTGEEVFAQFGAQS